MHPGRGDAAFSYRCQKKRSIRNVATFYKICIYTLRQHVIRLVGGGIERSCTPLQGRFLLRKAMCEATVSVNICAISLVFDAGRYTKSGRHSGDHFSEDIMQIAEHCEIVGRLMSPQEVYASTLNRSDIPSVIKHDWFLCGDIPEKMWDILMEGLKNVGFRISAFTSTVNTGYACFTVQVEGSQARFLIPLGGKKVARFLTDASLFGLHISIARNNSERAIVKKFGVVPGDVVPLQGIAKCCRDLKGRELMSDFMLAFAEISQISTIPSIFDGVSVDEAHVVIVSPN